MRLVGLIVVLLGILAACGKNDGVSGVGYSPYPAPAPTGGYPYPTQAPPPPSGAYMPPGGMPQNGYYPPGHYPAGYTPGYGAPYFMPTMPQGMPQQYYPYLPWDNYMTSSPAGSQYWGTMWNNWNNYAGANGYSPYDFTMFWTSYCPNYVAGGPYEGAYNSFNSNVYWFVGPDTEFPQNVDYGYFWEYYEGMPYSMFCDSGC